MVVDTLIRSPSKVAFVNNSIDRLCGLWAFPLRVAKTQIDRKLVNKANQIIILSWNRSKTIIRSPSETISSESVVCFRQESANLSPLRHIL